MDFKNKDIVQLKYSLSMGIGVVVGRLDAGDDPLLMVVFPNAPKGNKKRQRCRASGLEKCETEKDIYASKTKGK